MKDEGLRDGRKIPDEVMEHTFPPCSVRIREKGHARKVVAEISGFSRAAMAMNGSSAITEEIDAWLKETRRSWILPR